LCQLNLIERLEANELEQYRCTYNARLEMIVAT
jgi:hypothetical protein